ncbi:MAG: hypothetical protein ACT4P4_18095 [Betaproteobacteria bacterium]
MGRAAIEVQGLSFEYPGVRALDDVSLRIEPGGVTALVVHLAGIDMLEQPRASHRKVGFLSDFFGLYDALSVRRCLAHAAAANGVPAAEVAATVQRSAERMGLAETPCWMVGIALAALFALGAAALGSARLAAIAKVVERPLYAAFVAGGQCAVACALAAWRWRRLQPSLESR